MMQAYPEVLGELATMDLVCAGKSIARYGDGEFKIAHGGEAVAQGRDYQLTRRLADILKDSGDCLVGIPNIHEVLRTHTVEQKREFWARFLPARTLLVDRTYVSAFITRPDSAPWIDVPEYWTKLQSLWIGQDITLVRGSGKSLVAEDLVGANRITEIVGPKQHAFAEYGSLMKRILTDRPKRVLLCLGPCATALAVDLCRRGVHAIDLGHAGMFLRKHRDGRPMLMKKDEKALMAKAANA